MRNGYCREHSLAAGHEHAGPVGRWREASKLLRAARHHHRCSIARSERCRGAELDRGLVEALGEVRRQGRLVSVAGLQHLRHQRAALTQQLEFWERETAKRLAKAKDYPDRAREAIREMHRQVGVLRTSRDGLAKRGVLVRHLVMPGQGAEAAAIARWLAEELSPDTYLNVMGQYRPEYEVGEIAKKGQPQKREPKYG